MALWLPLMRGTLTKPAAQPISAPPGKHELRHRLIAALGDGAGAIANPLAAGERVAHQRMRLEALEFLERRQIRILVVEVDDKADRDQIVVEVIDERAAAGGIAERPAERVLHEAAPMLVRRDLPELFEADAEFLRLAILREAETLDQHLGQAAAGAFGEQSVFAAQLHAAGEAGFAMAVLADAHVAGGDAGDRIVLEQELRPRRSPDRFRRRALRPCAPDSGRPRRARR